MPCIAVTDVVQGWFDIWTTIMAKQVCLSHLSVSDLLDNLGIETVGSKECPTKATAPGPEPSAEPPQPQALVL